MFTASCLPEEQKAALGTQTRPMKLNTIGVPVTNLLELRGLFMFAFFPPGGTIRNDGVTLTAA